MGSKTGRRARQSQPLKATHPPATARKIASNVSTQLMLKTLFEVIATMADDPDRYRSGMRKKLLELADTMPLSPMAAAQEKCSFAATWGKQT
jgi:hypothetical protein